MNYRKPLFSHVFNGQLNHQYGIITHLCYPIDYNVIFHHETEVKGNVFFPNHFSSISL